LRYELIACSFFIVVWAFIIYSDANAIFKEYVLFSSLGTLVLLDLTLIALTAMTVRLMSIVSDKMG
jgi:hypothetical protein